MRKGQLKTITLAGANVQAQFLGRGRYTTAYKVGGLVYCFTKDIDVSKEVLRNIEMLHIPDITDLGAAGESAKLYRMPYYADISRTTSPEAFKQFRAIEKAWTDTIIQVRGSHRNSYEGMHCKVNARLHGILSQSSTLPTSILDAIQRINSAAANYSQNIGYDLKRTNFGVDDHGNLVFRDAIADFKLVYGPMWR
jgi:hypothetical protein